MPRSYSEHCCFSDAQVSELKAGKATWGIFDTPKAIGHRFWLRIMVEQDRKWHFGGERLLCTVESIDPEQVLSNEFAACFSAQVKS